ncbi:hypothetical protein ES705_47748 [subsurface metagenome]
MVKITEELLKEFFPNNFLIRVAFEIRFPADLTMKDNISNFQGKIKENFPVYEERYTMKFPVQDTAKGNLINYAFKNDINESEIYLNAYSSFGFGTKKYPGFKNFLNIFLDNVKIFKDMFKIESTTRLGMRYINSIPLEKDKQKSNTLKNNYFDFCLTEDQKYDFENQYEIHKQLIFQKGQQKFYDVIIDLDNSYKEKILIKEDLKELESRIFDLHNLIKIKFFEIIKEEFLELLKKKK